MEERFYKCEEEESEDVRSEGQSVDDLFFFENSFGIGTVYGMVQMLG